MTEVKTDQLTSEQIAAIFALYLGCEMKYSESDESSTLESIATSGLVGDENRDESGEGWYDVSDCKLLLTPLSKISDEDAIEVIKIFHVAMGKMSRIKAQKYIPHVRRSGTYEKNIECWQFLIQRGYAVPLFIEPNHPANGKTAIELNLAIDKTLHP